MEKHHCRHVGCGFTSRSSVGVETHMAKSHRVTRATASAAERTGCVTMTVPRALSGKGARLPIDRLTREQLKMCGDDTAAKDEEYESFKRQVMSDVDIDMEPPASLQSIEREHEDFEEICSAFIDLSRRAGDRHCDALLTVLAANVDKIPSFLSTCISVDHMRKYRRQKLERKYRMDGFREAKIATSDGLTASVFLRDPRIVLCKQVRATSASGFIADHSTGERYSHPTNSTLGKALMKLAENCIKSNVEDDVYWRKVDVDGERSAIGLLQMFSDKSVTTLSSSAFSFYPMHVTFLNFTESARRDHISSGRTVFAYLPVSYEREGSLEVTEGRVGNSSNGRAKRFSRLELLRALHKSIAFAVEPLKLSALRGIQTVSADNCHRRLHLTLASYIGDKPEIEDILGVKRGAQTTRPCHCCLIQRSQLPYSGVAQPRRLIDAQRILSDLDSDVESQHEAAKEELWNNSMLAIAPALSSFPMIGLHECNDVYAICRFEPLHNLSLGISRLLKECVTVMLKDEARTTLTILSKAGVPRTFKTIRKAVLCSLNDFLKEVERTSRGYNLNVDFCKGETGGRISGFFVETGVMGMLEGKDFDTVDMVSPFLGAIVDLCCGLTARAEVTESFTRYVDMCDFIFRRRMSEGWTETELSHLSDHISGFKDHTRATFSSYQASGMGTTKWHALDHVVEDLRQMGGIQYINGSMYERAHRHFKEDYQLTSRRRCSAMTETMQKQQDRMLTQPNDIDADMEPCTTPNPSRVRAVQEDGGYLVRSGDRMKIGDLESARLMSREVGSEEGSRMRPPRCAVEVARHIGEDGLSSLLDLLYEEMQRQGVPAEEARHMTLHSPASGYISAFFPPTLDNPHVGDSVYVRRKSLRISQRVVAKYRFYGSMGRTDTLMIEGSETSGGALFEQYFPVWFGRALAFFRFPEIPLGSAREYCFVQYYEALDDSLLPIDAIDRALNCVRLRWHRTPGNEEYGAGKEYGLVPMDSIRGRVHVVPADVAVKLVGESVERRMAQRALCDEAGWPSQLFYLNRFYRCKSEIYDFK